MMLVGSPPWSRPHSFDWSSVVRTWSLAAAWPDADVVELAAVEVDLPDALQAAAVTEAMSSQPLATSLTDRVSMGGTSPETCPRGDALA
jgi:hypothetical protein